MENVAKIDIDLALAAADSEASGGGLAVTANI